MTVETSAKTFTGQTFERKRVEIVVYIIYLDVLVLSCVLLACRYVGECSYLCCSRQNFLWNSQ